MRRTLQQLEPHEQLDMALLQTIQRIAHKMKGSAGTIGYMTLSTLAHHMEELSKLLMSGAVAPFVGLHALTQTLQAVEATLNSVVTYNQENTMPLDELEAAYKALDISFSRTYGASVQLEAPVRIPFHAPQEDESQPAGRMTRPLAEPSASTPLVRVDVGRFEQLLLHSEKLSELRAPLESAQAGMEQAIQELHEAQARLSHL